MNSFLIGNCVSVSPVFRWSDTAKGWYEGFPLETWFVSIRPSDQSINQELSRPILATYPWSADFFLSPSSAVPGSMVAVQRFVIRTSGEHWTALSCWGSPGCLAEVTENLHVGDSGGQIILSCFSIWMRYVVYFSILSVCVLNPREKFLQSPMNGDKSSADPRSWLPSMPWYSWWVDWLIRSSVDWLIDWLIDLVIDPLIDWFECLSFWE